MIRTYFNEKAPNWDNFAAEKDTQRLEAVVSRLFFQPDSTILDVGSGTGIFIPYLLKKMGNNGTIIALDIAEQMLKVSCIKKHSGNVIFIQGDITHPPFKEGVFDSVICYSSFPHFQDKPKALRETARLLKKSGTLYICHTSSRDHINGIHKNIPLLHHDMIPDSETLRDMLQNAGYNGIRIEDEEESFFISAVKCR